MIINGNLYALDAVQTWGVIIMIASLVTLWIQGKAEGKDKD